jgi:uncharacterized membrane protein YdcZ (DUF606 family)
MLRKLLFLVLIPGRSLATDSPKHIEAQVTTSTRRIVVASVLAGTSAVGTLCFPSLSNLSGNAFVAALQMAASSVLFPGLVGAVAVSGNVHVYSFLGGCPN